MPCSPKVPADQNEGLDLACPVSDVKRVEWFGHDGKLVSVEYLAAQSPVQSPPIVVPSAPNVRKRKPNALRPIVVVKPTIVVLVINALPA